MPRLKKPRRQAAAVAVRERDEREIRGDGSPREVATAGRAKAIARLRVAEQQIQTRLDAVHAVHEQREVNARRPPQSGPRRRLRRQQARQHGEERVGRNRRAAVEGECAPPLENQTAIG